MHSDAYEGNRLKEAGFITIMGGIANAVLAAGKISLGMWTQYLPMTASGFHSLSDIVSDVITWFTLMLGSRRADRRFNYGYRRIETLMSLFAALFLVYVSVELVMDSFGGGHDHGAPAAITEMHDAHGHAEHSPQDKMPAPPVDGDLLLVVASILSLVIKEALFRTTRRKGMQLNSPMLIAKAWHHRADAASSAAVLLSVIISHFFPSLTMVDQVTTIFISGMILHSAWEVGITAVKELIDFAPSLKTVALIEEMAEKVLGVTFIHGIKIRTMGGALNVELTVEIEPTTPLAEGFAITERIRKEIMDHVPNVVDASIIMSPKGEYLRRFWDPEAHS